MPFGREIYIDADDFMENPPKKYFRLAPNQKVRLKHAYIIQCDEVVKDEAGNIAELRCTYLPNSRSGADTSGVSVKGTIHWVSAAHAKPVELRLYQELFTLPSLADVPEDKDFLDFLNPDSLKVQTAFAEPAISEAQAGDKFQFLRKGYYCADDDSTADKPVFNLTVSLKDSWAKVAAKG